MNSTTEHNWVTVGQYSDPLSAGIVSKRLTEEGVPNRVWVPPRSAGECYIWVAPESLEAAKEILSQPAVSEEDLTALALQDPPPDDFEADRGDSGARASGVQNPIVRSSGRSFGWLIAVLFIGLLVALFAYLPIPPTSREVAREHSPNGRMDAVLLDIPHDVAGVHGYRVCLQGWSATPVRPGYCSREVAYLAGVRDGSSRSVALVWTTPSDLEIRYTNAASVHLYQAIVVSGSRYGARPVITVRLVQTGKPANIAPP